MTYITRIATKRILVKYFLYSLQINYLHWKISASRSIFSCYATYNSAPSPLERPVALLSKYFHSCFRRRIQRYIKRHRSPALSKSYRGTKKVDFYSLQKVCRQCRALDALICFVADNILPLSFVESSSFRKYCFSLDPCFMVPTRKHLFNTLLAIEHKGIRNNYNNCEKF